MSHPSVQTSSLCGLCDSIITSTDFLYCSRWTRVIISMATGGISHLSINKCCFGGFSETTDSVFLRRTVSTQLEFPLWVRKESLIIREVSMLGEIKKWSRATVFTAMSLLYQIVVVKRGSWDWRWSSQFAVSLCSHPIHRLLTQSMRWQIQAAEMSFVHSFTHIKKGLGMVQLHFWIERSQLRWFKHLIRIPPSGNTVLEDTLGLTQNTWRDEKYPIWPGNACGCPRKSWRVWRGRKTLEAGFTKRLWWEHQTNSQTSDRCLSLSFTKPSSLS